MLQILSILIIHSTPFDEVAQGPPPPKGLTGAFSLEEGKTIQVNQFQFSGNQAISSQDLNKLLSQYKNTMVSKVDLQTIQQNIVSFYKMKGYDDVKVSIPAKQTSETLTIVIVEGKINH